MSNSGIRPNIGQLHAYTPGKPIQDVQRELGLENVVKLASNENPLGPSPKAVEAMVGAAHRAHLYPDASGREVKECLSSKHSIPTNQIFLGNGSDELLDIIGRIFLTSGDNIVMGDPTFVRYEAAGILAECDIRKVPLTDEWVHDLPKMRAACDSRTKLVYLANPHNPTGTVVTQSDVLQIVDILPLGCHLIIDEAYFEYARDASDPVDGLELVKLGYPVIALRTLSKVYGLAGIRFGYGFASEEITDAVNRARNPFNTSAIAQAAAVAALQDSEFLARSQKANREGINWLTKEMARLGYATIPSWANFVCIQVDQDPQRIFEELLKLGVIIRPGEKLGLPHHIRVSIGTSEEMNIFLAAFEKVNQMVKS